MVSTRTFCTHIVIFFVSPKFISLLLRLVYWKCSLVLISTADLHIHKMSNDPLTVGLHSGTVVGGLINHWLRPTAIWFAILLRTAAIYSNANGLNKILEEEKLFREKIN